MDRSRGRPAYLQIADDIRSRILDGTLSQGDKLPSEVELMSDYGVSRIVVRMAVEVLESEGLVTKRQGKGSFVRPLKPLYRRIVGDLYVMLLEVALPSTLDEAGLEELLERVAEEQGMDVSVRALDGDVL